MSWESTDHGLPPRDNKPHFTSDYWYQLHLITSLPIHIHTVKQPQLGSLFRSQTCTTLVEVAGFYSANTYVDCTTRFMYIVLVLSWWRHQMQTFSALLAFVRGIHRWPVNSPHKGQWRGALICARINGWLNKREGGDLRRYRAHYNVTTMTVRRWTLSFMGDMATLWILFRILVSLWGEFTGHWWISLTKHK